MKRFATVLASLALLSACTAGYLPTSTDGGTSPDGGTTSATKDLKLTVLESKGVAKIGTTTAKSGSFFATIRVQLENVGTTATPMRFPSFSLEVDGGAAYAASTITTQVTSGCVDNVSVEPKGKHDCWVAFEVPTAKPVRVLHYKTAEVADLKVNVTVEPPSTTGKLACDYAAVSGVVEMCGECIQTFCAEPANTYLTNECSTGSSCTSAPYCTCERNALPSTTCKTAYDAIQACIVKSCTECLNALQGG